MTIVDAIKQADVGRNSTIVRAKSVRPIWWLQAIFRPLGRVAPGAAAQLAKRLIFTSPASKPRADEESVLARAGRFSLKTRQGRIEGYMWGKGPPVLLIHGWGGHAGHMTGFVEPLVRAGFRPTALDMPGHGASDGRQSSLVHFAAAIEAALEILSPVHGMIGHSLGAAAVVNVLARRPDINRAVLIAPPAQFDAIWETFKTRLGLSDAVFERMVKLSEAWLKTSFDTVVPVRSAGLVKAPVLVLHDPEDRQVSAEEGAKLASRFPDGGFLAMPGLGHMRILKDWRSVLEAVQFLKPRRARHDAVRPMQH